MPILLLGGDGGKKKVSKKGKIALSRHNLPRVPEHIATSQSEWPVPKCICDRSPAKKAGGLCSYLAHCCCPRCAMCVPRWRVRGFPRSASTPYHRGLCSRRAAGPRKKKKKERKSKVKTWDGEEAPGARAPGRAAPVPRPVGEYVPQIIPCSRIAAPQRK